MSCRLVEFALFVDVLEVKADVLLRSAEQLCDLLLAEPNGVRLEPHFQGGTSVVAHVENDLTTQLPVHPAPSNSATIASISKRNSACRATIPAISAFNALMSTASVVSSCST